LEGLRIVLSFQEPEKTGGVFVTLEMELVHLSTDTSHWSPTAIGQPKPAFRMLEEGIAFR
jgi:hypothetical protein